MNRGPRSSAKEEGKEDVDQAEFNAISELTVILKASTNYEDFILRRNRTIHSKQNMENTSFFVALFTGNLELITQYIDQDKDKNKLNGKIAQEDIFDSLEEIVKYEQAVKQLGKPTSEILSSEKIEQLKQSLAGKFIGMPYVHYAVLGLHLTIADYMLSKGAKTNYSCYFLNDPMTLKRSTRSQERILRINRNLPPSSKNNAYLYSQDQPTTILMQLIAHCLNLTKRNAVSLWIGSQKVELYQLLLKEIKNAVKNGAEVLAIYFNLIDKCTDDRIIRLEIKKALIDGLKNKKRALHGERVFKKTMNELEMVSALTNIMLGYLNHDVICEQQESRIPIPEGLTPENSALFKLYLPVKKKITQSASEKPIKRKAVDSEHQDSEKEVVSGAKNKKAKADPEENCAHILKKSKKLGTRLKNNEK